MLQIRDEGVVVESEMPAHHVRALRKMTWGELETFFGLPPLNKELLVDEVNQRPEKSHDNQA